jgi:very-short-patch-repair endonuclease
MRAGQDPQCGDVLERQEQVIARWQAAGLGLDQAVLDAELRSRRWRPLYRGVYAAFTGQPPRSSLLWAAVLRAGPDAGLSHHSAAEADGLTDQQSGLVHVTVPVSRQIRFSSRELKLDMPRIVVHRSARLPGTLQAMRSPPRTRIEETVLDLVDVSETFDDALRWPVTACARRRTTQPRLLAAIEARPKLRWRAELTGALDDIGAGTHSLLEFRYVRWVERPHGLPAATRQARAWRESRSQYLDNLYADFGVAVELDGRAAHQAEERWRDAHRDNFFAVMGVTTLRYSWSDVTDRPCAVAAEVGRVLAQRGWAGRLAPCGPACLAALSVMGFP